MEINIIGAGPVGSYTAYLLAKKGHHVNLFEEHQEIGRPVQCTGIVTGSFSKIIPLRKQFLTNITKQFRIISPNNTQALVKKKEFILDRSALDQYLAKKAQDQGVQLYLNHRFIAQNNSYLIFKNKEKNKNIKKTITIGSDGPLSPTAKAFNFPNQNQFYYGFQARIRGNFDPRTTKVSFGNKVAPGFFSWLVPESTETARIGLATHQKTNLYFNRLIKEHKNKIINLQAGLIPVYNPQIKTQHLYTYLIGDAATQVKATTGGGLIPGFKAAQALSQAVHEKKDYPKTWKKTVGKKLKKHLQIREVLNQFSDKNYDCLIRALKNKKINRILQKMDREQPSLRQSLSHLF